MDHRNEMRNCQQPTDQSGMSQGLSGAEGWALTDRHTELSLLTVRCSRLMNRVKHNKGALSSEHLAWEQTH